MSYAQLIAGYQRFKANDFQSQADQYQHLAEQGQSPKVMCISCADSRVDPLAITQSGPGQVFAIRNVANLIPPWSEDPQKRCFSTEAALRYAVLHLHVEHLIVMGHAQCGGIRALIADDPDAPSQDPIHQWVRHLAPAKAIVQAQYPEATEAHQACHCERQGLICSQQHLLCYPFIAEKVAQQKLAIHLWHFDIATGQLEAYDANTKHFVAL